MEINNNNNINKNQYYISKENFLKKHNNMQHKEIIVPVGIKQLKDYKPKNDIFIEFDLGVTKEELENAFKDIEKNI